MTTAVRFDRRGSQYAVMFAYDPNLVALVKTVPVSARSWKPESKVWLVDGSHVAQLARSMRELGYLVTGLVEPRPAPRTDWAQLLFQRVGHQRAEPVFRALTKVLHPDTDTGDTALQRELNNARDDLSKGTP
jgi:hypothetical protein